MFPLNTDCEVCLWAQLAPNTWAQNCESMGETRLFLHPHFPRMPSPGRPCRTRMIATLRTNLDAIFCAVFKLQYCCGVCACVVWRHSCMRVEFEYVQCLRMEAEDAKRSLEAGIASSTMNHNLAGAEDSFCAHSPGVSDHFECAARFRRSFTL